jgi:hypothetical protein
MALTTGTKAGDMSGCVEATVGYFGYNRFDSGKIGVSFDYTGGSDERLFGKDVTMMIGDATVFNNALYVEYITLSTCGTAGPVALIDGSQGIPIVTLSGSDVSYGNGNSGEWDFKDDPLVCLTADNTDSLCVSSALDGWVSGYVKCYWGPVSS